MVDVPARVTSVNPPVVVNFGDDGGGGDAPADAATLDVAFADPGVGEHHRVSVNWGDGTTTAVAPGGDGSVTLAESGGSGTVQGTHAYATSGTFAVTLTITDDAGGTPGNGLAVYTFPVGISYEAPSFSMTATAAAAGSATAVVPHASGFDAAGVTGWSVDWGDGTAPTAVAGGGLADPPPAGGGPQFFGGSYSWPAQTHAYAAAGHYLVTATPTDGAGPHAGAATATVAVAEPGAGKGSGVD